MLKNSISEKKFTIFHYNLFPETLETFISKQINRKFHLNLYNIIWCQTRLFSRNCVMKLTSRKLVLHFTSNSFLTRVIIIFAHNLKICTCFIWHNFKQNTINYILKLLIMHQIFLITRFKNNLRFQFYMKLSPNHFEIKNYPRFE